MECKCSDWSASSRNRKPGAGDKFILRLINTVFTWRQIRQILGKGQEATSCGCLSHRLCCWKKGCVGFCFFPFTKKLHTYWGGTQGRLSVILMAPDDETVFKKVTETLDGHVNTQWLSPEMEIISITHTLGKRSDTTLRRGGGNVSAQLQPTVTDVPPNNHSQPSQCQLQLP